MEYHADPMERYQRGDYPEPKPVFPVDVKHGKGVVICRTCHKPEKHNVYSHNGKHKCSGPCPEWNTCRLLRFHPEEQERREDILYEYKQNQKAWCDQQNAMLAEARRQAKLQQKQQAEQKIAEEKAARVADLARHQLGNPGELSRFLQAFGASEKSTLNPMLLNNVLKRTREIDKEQETLGANKRQKVRINCRKNTKINA